MSMDWSATKVKGIHVVTYDSAKASGPRRTSTDENTKSVFLKGSGQVAEILESGVMEVDGVTVEFSEEAKRELKKAQKEASQKQEQQMTNWMMEMNRESIEQSTEAIEDAYEDMAKLMEIARRISRGDRVPGTDEQKLIEFSKELYQMAKQAGAAAQNKKRKEHEALFKDEDEGQTQPAAGSEPPTEQTVVEVEVSTGGGDALSESN